MHLTKKIDSYATCLSFLESLPTREQWDLERTRLLCEHTGVDATRLKAVHVTGTNGKGSVCAMLAEILQQAGYRIGFYSSPHLLDFRERIQINGRKISKRDFLNLFLEFKPFIEEMTREDKAPSFFEATTVIAFKHFLEQHVDYAVVEVGLGGRLDATNVVEPLVSVITNVALEHTENLGNTVEKIAWEKSGIIKHGVPVVTAASGKALSVIKKVAKEKNSLLYFVDARKITGVSCSLEGTRFQFEGKKYFTSLAGAHQAVNAAVAIKTIDALRKNGVVIPQTALNKGLAKVSWPARIHVVSRKPLVILDGAHNPHGALALVKAANAIFKRRKIILVAGVLKDKDYAAMVKLFSKLKPKAVIACQPNTERALSASALAELFKQQNQRVILQPSVREAIKKAKALAGEKDAILITGSLYTAGEALGCLTH